MTSIEDHTHSTPQVINHSPINKVSNQISNNGKNKKANPNNKEMFTRELLDKEHFDKLKKIVKKSLKLMGYHVLSGEKGLGKRVHKKYNISYVALKTIEISNKKRILRKLKEKSL